MHLGILECGRPPEPLLATQGTYGDIFKRMLAGRGFDFSTFHVEAMEFPSGIEAADGWLLTGSCHSAYDDRPFIAPLEDFIRRAYVAHVPQVGICFGHQIMAQALGGRVVKNPAGWAVGAHDYDFNGTRLTINCWHQDQVVLRPVDAEVAGTSPFCPNAALIYGDRAFSLQPHPELNDAFITGLVELSKPGEVPQELLDKALARRGEATGAPRIADEITAFLTQPRAMRVGA